MVSEPILDVPQAARLPQTCQARGLSERVGEQAVARQPGLWIDRRSGVPEQALVHEPAAKIPDRRGEHAAGARDAPHLQYRPGGVGHEVERQLGDRAGKRARLERQARGVRLGRTGCPGRRPALAQRPGRRPRRPPRTRSGRGSGAAAQARDCRCRSRRRAPGRRPAARRSRSRPARDGRSSARESARRRPRRPPGRRVRGQ